MAQSGINIGTDALPSIFKILGLSGGDSTDALASTAGGNSSAMQPPSNTVPFAPPPEDVTPPQQPKSVPTKLGRLQQIIQASQGNIDHPTMTDEHSSPMTAPDPTTGLDQPQMPPPDLAQSMAAGTAQIKPTFQEAHPTLLKIIKGLATTAEGGLAGTGAMTAGEGFQRAHELTDPIRKQMEDAALAEKKAQTAHQAAVTKQMGDMVTLPNGLTVPFAMAQRLYPTLVTEQGKNTRAQAGLDSKESIAADKNALALRKQGLKLDANGKQVPLTRDEMSESEQATLDLKQSQQDAAAARAELDRQKNDPNSAAYKAAMGRLQVAAKNAETAAGRLGLAKDTFNANYFGTGPTGEALPGAALTDNGTPVGVRVSNVTKPTNATRSKAEQAGVIKQQGEDILRQIDANPELYGVVAGRWNEFNAGKFGNASPEVRDAYTSLKSFAALQPALHGARGVGMMREFEDAVGSMANNPEALKASINSLMRTSSAFQKAGTMKTAPGGGAKNPAATHVYDPSTGVIAPVGK